MIFTKLLTQSYEHAIEPSQNIWPVISFSSVRKAGNTLNHYISSGVMFEKVFYVTSQLKCHTLSAVLRCRLYIMMVEGKFATREVFVLTAAGIVVPTRDFKTLIIQVAAAVYVTMDLIIDK